MPDVKRTLTLYVPLADNRGRARPEVAETIASAVVSLAGGATVTHGEGYWMGSRLFREPVALVSALIDPDADLAPFRELAGHVRDILGQESTLLTVSAPLSVEFSEAAAPPLCPHGLGMLDPCDPCDIPADPRPWRALGPLEVAADPEASARTATRPGGGSDLELASRGHTCGACGRPEWDCSATPCAAVIRDRGGRS